MFTRNTPAKELDRFVRKAENLDDRMKKMLLGLKLNDFSYLDMRFLIDHSKWALSVPPNLQVEAYARYEIVRTAAILELITMTSIGYLRSLVHTTDADSPNLMTTGERQRLLVALQRLAIELSESIEKDESSKQPQLDQPSNQPAT